MAKNDIELGEWKATAIVNGTTIMQFSKGFSFKNRKEFIAFRIRCPEGTTTKQMSDYMAQATLGEIAR